MKKTITNPPMKKTIRNSPSELKQRKVGNGEVKANPLFARGKCIKKKNLISIRVVGRKIRKSEEEEDKKVNDAEVKKSDEKKLVDIYVDDPEVKRTLSNWRLVKQVTQHKVEKIQNIREVARKNLDKIQNTACFNDNIDAMNEFYKLIGYSG